MVKKWIGSAGEHEKHLNVAQIGTNDKTSADYIASPDNGSQFSLLHSSAYHGFVVGIVVPLQRS